MEGCQAEKADAKRPGISHRFAQNPRSLIRSPNFWVGIASDGVKRRPERKLESHLASVALRTCGLSLEQRILFAKRCIGRTRRRPLLRPLPGTLKIRERLVDATRRFS